MIAPPSSRSRRRARARRRHGLSRPLDRRRRRSGRRSGVQHRDDRLPGNPHRPVYCRQIVTLTYPHIGNVGVNAEDVEVAQASTPPAWSSATCRCCASNFRAQRDAGASTCSATSIVAIADIDTRKLTRILREKGAQNGCIVAAGDVGDADVEARARAGARRAVDGRAGPRQGRQRARALRMDARRDGRSAAAIGTLDDAALPRRRLRLRRQAQHPAHARRARLQRHRACRRRRPRATCWR